jgi:hypothetical protein
MLILLGIDAALGGYVAYLWARGHAALLQGPPHGLSGHGFLAYLAVVVALATASVWVLMVGRRLTPKVLVVILDGLAVVAYLHVLSGQQQQFVQWVALSVVLANVFLVANAIFWVGLHIEGRSRVGSLEVHQ